MRCDHCHCFCRDAPRRFCEFSVSVQHTLPPVEATTLRPIAAGQQTELLQQARHNLSLSASPKGKQQPHTWWVLRPSSALQCCDRPHDSGFLTVGCWHGAATKFVDCLMISSHHLLSAAFSLLMACMDAMAWHGAHGERRIHVCLSHLLRKDFAG